MPRSRGSEIPQRLSSRGLHPLRTSSADSDPLHNRPVTDRSPKLGDRRSPRGPQPDPLNQKKLGTRIADLESQLGQAQDELKNLKDQLALAEAAKMEAQKELEKKSKKPAAPEPEKDSKERDSKSADKVCDENQQETDVFEVPVEEKTDEPKLDSNCQNDEVETKDRLNEISAEPLTIPEPEKPSFNDLSLKDDEINALKAKLEENEREVGIFCDENESLKNQLNEATASISAAKAKEEEMHVQISQLGEELGESKVNVAKLKEKVETTEGVNAALETEMKKMRVQTEQWRKAADAAAAVLAGDVEMNGRIPERCGSMDKHFAGMFDPSAGGYSNFVGSPGMADDLEDGFSNGKRKGLGIKVFGDLWKRKGHK